MIKTQQRTPRSIFLYVLYLLSLSVILFLDVGVLETGEGLYPLSLISVLSIADVNTEMMSQNVFETTRPFLWGFFAASGLGLLYPLLSSTLLRYCSILSMFISVILPVFLTSLLFNLLTLNYNRQLDPANTFNFLGINSNLIAFVEFYAAKNLTISLLHSIEVFFATAALITFFLFKAALRLIADGKKLQPGSLQ